MTDKEYNCLVELRNKCYRDRRDRETDINYFTGFNDGYEKGKESLEENAELKSRVGLSIECDKAQKNGELCLGYGGDEDEPCERCKNCIKCECGYYQLGETEKDEQLTNAKEIIKDLLSFVDSLGNYSGGIFTKAEQFLNGEGCPDCLCEDCTKDCGIKKLGLVEIKEK